jgi:hypothetical protein
MTDRSEKYDGEKDLDQDAIVAVLPPDDDWVSLPPSNGEIAVADSDSDIAMKKMAWHSSLMMLRKSKSKSRP